MFPLYLKVSLAVLTVLAELVLGATAQGFTLPLRRVRRSGRAPSAGQAGAGDVAVTSSFDYAYLIPININGQDFSVMLDTGSADLWVVSTDCTSADCAGVAKYAKDGAPPSPLAGTPFALSYLLGSVTGTLDAQTVTLGPYAVDGQVFALANNTAALGLAATGNSGVLGLGFPPIAAIAPAAGTTLLQNIYAALPEAQRFFAVHLARAPLNSSSPPAGADAGTGGSFTIGALAPALAAPADLALTPVSRAGARAPDFWKLPLHALTLNGSARALAASRVRGAAAPLAVLDTGTTLVLGPAADVDALWRAAGGARRGAGGRWEVRCARAVRVGLVLGDGAREYALHPADVSWGGGGGGEGGEGGDGWCMGGIQANDGVTSGDWLLGDVFLRNVYAVHYAATADSPPLIGLRSTTDADAALAEFRAARGPDPGGDAPGTVLARTAVPAAAGARPLAVYAASVAAGAVGGAAVALVLRARMRRRARRG